ncbi:MAG: hypothetical protein JO242_00310, partial [Streptosporangiaceae bacterium]|nr:hypothetical protein [Streptosporangiaceae bacterium]
CSRPPSQRRPHRLLASLPDVQDLGPAAGGERLRILVDPPPASKFPPGKVPAHANEIIVVVDKSIAMLRSWTDSQGTETVLDYGWTNAMPRIIDGG